jgi:hypothetical protein
VTGVTLAELSVKERERAQCVVRSSSFHQYTHHNSPNFTICINEIVDKIRLVLSPNQVMNTSLVKETTTPPLGCAQVSQLNAIRTTAYAFKYVRESHSS